LVDCWTLWMSIWHCRHLLIYAFNFYPFSCSVFLYEHFVCMSFLTLSAVNKGGKQSEQFFFYIKIVALYIWLLFRFRYHHHDACLVILYRYIFLSVRAESKTQYKRVIVVVAVECSRRVIERRWNREMNCLRHRPRL
jgi:hypothetical protein